MEDEEKLCGNCASHNGFNQCNSCDSHVTVAYGHTEACRYFIPKDYVSDYVDDYVDAMLEFKNTIRVGDTVEYIDVKHSKEKRKNVKVSKQGVWDGEKVILNDKEQTTVRNLKWLRKL